MRLPNVRGDGQAVSLASTLPSASIVITTRNRRDEVRTAIESAVNQTVHPQVIVIDDGSTDGTSEMVRARFPHVEVIQHATSRGYIARRNEGARTAVNHVIVSIDDDAAFSSPRVVEQALAAFASERVGAVTIPYIDVRRNQRVRQAVQDPKHLYVVDSYVGTAHAVRRDVFVELGGYREDLVHQGEEMDFCLRLLDAGYVVGQANADPIHHFESLKRDLGRMDYYGARNAVIFAWRNVPFPFLLVHLPVTTLRCVLLTLRPHRLVTRLSGVVDGYLDCCTSRREPVSWSAYRLARSLRKNGPRRLADLDGRLACRQRI